MLVEHRDEVTSPDKHRSPMKVWAVLCLAVLIAVPSHAQKTQNNPFELAAVHKLTTSPSQQGVGSPAANPFDIIGGKRVGAQRAETGLSSNPFELVGAMIGGPQITMSPPAAPVQSRHSSPSITLIFSIITGLLVLITLAITGANETLQKCVRALTNENWLRVLLREHRRRTNYALYWLSALGFLSLGFFVFLTLAKAGFQIKYTITNYLILSGTLLCLHLIRQLVLATVGMVFGLGDMMGRYRLGLTIFAMLPGLALFPFSVGLAFAPMAFSIPIVYIGLGIFGFLNFYYALNALASNRKRILKNKFRFFLYLCIVEIAPVLLIFKLLLDFSANV